VRYFIQQPFIRFNNPAVFFFQVFNLSSNELFPTFPVSQNKLLLQGFNILVCMCQLCRTSKEAMPSCFSSTFYSESFQWNDPLIKHCNDPMNRTQITEGMIRPTHADRKIHFFDKLTCPR